MATAEFGKPAPPGEPYMAASEMFCEMLDRYRRLVGRAAALGDREAKLDLLSLNHDTDRWSREFEGVLFDLGTDSDMRAEQVGRAKVQLANLSMDIENARTTLARLSDEVEKLR
jgi:hypothetical protein